jgi:hypothetical protein
VHEKNLAHLDEHQVKAIATNVIYAVAAK